ncbi:MAG: prolipoprotein diacylglyceryl transferase [Oligoflexia bacterium]|nr:prolipoprotein diacylglyceryl transferase [Oligoflexia bacterium]
MVIFYYQLLMACTLGILASVSIYKIFGKFAKTSSISFLKSFLLCLWVIPFTWVGGKFAYMLFDVWYDSTNMTSSFIERFWESGLIFYGGLFGAVLAILLIRRKIKISKEDLRLFLPVFALAHAVGRIGCFIEGCCYGRQCVENYFWCIFRNGNKIHPTQLYEAGYLIVLYSLLNYAIKHDSSLLETATIYLGGYALGRFILEFYRGEIYNVNVFLSLNQWISLVILLLIIVVSSKFMMNYNKK